jgi:hypothetical protein
MISLRAMSMSITAIASFPNPARASFGVMMPIAVKKAAAAMKITGADSRLEYISAIMTHSVTVTII